ncbi:PAS domain-containing protein [Metapseudomonas otitidis]|nr:PAS domain-containing protein [Pseudomonas otitidis]
MGYEPISCSDAVNDSDVMDAIKQTLAILYTDSTGVITEVSSTLCLMLAYNARQLCGYHCSQLLVRGEEKATFRNLLGNFPITEKRQGYVQAVRGDSSLIWLDVTCIPLISLEGSHHKTLSIIKDGTSFMKQHRQLQNFMRANLDKL